MPALFEAVGFEAVLGIHQAIVGAIPPEEMATSLAVMLPAMNLDDRAELLGGMRAGAPAEVFQGVWSLAGSGARPGRPRRPRDPAGPVLTRASTRSIRSASRRQATPKRARRMVSPAAQTFPCEPAPHPRKAPPMFTTRSSSNRSLRRRVGIAASTAALAIGFLGASPAGAAAGDLDTQFSGDGIQTGITGTQNATASFLQLDAKLVVAGNGAYDDGTVQKSGTYVARYDHRRHARPGATATAA